MARGLVIIEADAAGGFMVRLDPPYLLVPPLEFDCLSAAAGAACYMANEHGRRAIDKTGQLSRLQLLALRMAMKADGTQKRLREAARIDRA